MESRLSFAAMPFEAYDGFVAHAFEHDEFAFEEEAGRRGGSRGASRVLRRGRPASSRGRSSRSRGPMPRSRGQFPGHGHRQTRHGHHALQRGSGRHRGYDGDYGAEPSGDDPSAGGGSDYVRWVQNALNGALGLQLPPTGISDAPTRSAIRSFQQSQGLPPSGVVGPGSDTEHALIAAAGMGSQGAPAQATAAAPAPTDAPPPDAAAPPAGDPPPASEFEFGSPGGARPTARRRCQPRLAGSRPISDREVAAMLRMAAKNIPDVGITVEDLLTRHQAEAGGIPVEVLLAMIHRGSGGRFDDATTGVWQQDQKKHVPPFYRLGIFHTPGGDHGCVNHSGAAACSDPPPGSNVENSRFGKGWQHLAGAYPTPANWKDPTMQVRVGLWDLTSTAGQVRGGFAALFPSTQSEWYLRMAVLYAAAAGAGAARSYLRKYKKQLAALPESQRWDFLRDKNVGASCFEASNVDDKMALATKLRDVRRAPRRAMPSAG